MLLDLPIQLAHVPFYCLAFGPYRMARHGDAQVQGSAVHSGEDGAEGGGCGFGLGLSTVKTLVELEQRLADWVRVGHFAVVHEGDVPHAPSLKRDKTDGMSKGSSENRYGGDTDHQSSGHVAAQSSGAKEKAASLLDGVQVQFWKQPPLHKLQVEIDGRLGESLWVHRGRQVDHPGAHLAPFVLLPAETFASRDDRRRFSFQFFESKKEAVAHSPLAVFRSISPAENVQTGKEIGSVMGH